MAHLRAAVAARQHLPTHVTTAPGRDITVKESEVHLPAETRPFSAQFARRAGAAVADSLTRVPPTRKRLSTRLAAVPLPRAADNFPHRLPADAWTRDPDAAGIAGTLVAHLLTRVDAAGKQLPAHLPTRKLLVCATPALHLLPAEAPRVHLVRARRARAWVAQQQTCVPTRGLERLPTDLPA